MWLQTQALGLKGTSWAIPAGELGAPAGAVSSGDSQLCRDGATQEITFPSCPKDTPDTAAWTLFCLLLHKPLIPA